MTTKLHSHFHLKIKEEIDDFADSEFQNSCKQFFGDMKEEDSAIIGEFRQSKIEREIKELFEKSEDILYWETISYWVFIPTIVTQLLALLSNYNWDYERANEQIKK